MMVYAQPAAGAAVHHSPESPPGMTTSKSSKSSSFHSISSDDNSVLSDVNHFEDIGLDDDVAAAAPHYDRGAEIKALPNRFSPSFPADLRAASLLQQKAPHVVASRELARTRPHSRDVLSQARPPYPALHTHTHTQGHGRPANVRSTSTSALTPDALPPKRGGLLSKRSMSSLTTFRPRSPSPGSPGSLGSPGGLGLAVNVPHGLKNPAVVVKPRRGSWQSTVERKTALQLELECDEDVGDDIPDGLILDNVPISPRPPSERSRSTSPPASIKSASSSSQHRSPRDKTKSVGNGTPPVAAAQGSLRSPAWKAAEHDSSSGGSGGDTANPVKLRARSWTAALSSLSLEAKDLTEKLEEHADEQQLKAQLRASLPNVRRRVATEPGQAKPRHKSALPELPPLRRNDIMVDPLPVSKEKEAVLSRTRPSWLPPKDPAEERRHLKQYQKMMACSMEAERRREANKKARSDCRDTAASSVMQIWEQDILPRWTEAVRERRTRDLWWRGIAPRSRGAVWARAIGNELGLTEASFAAALGRARAVEARAAAAAGGGTAAAGDEPHAACFAAIRADVEQRTWRELKIFQAGAPLHQGLMDVLMAYALYRSDIGYVSGCHAIAAMLLLNLPGPASAFVALANILNRPLPLSFYAGDAGAKASAYNLLLQTLAAAAPGLHAHLTTGLADPDPAPDAYLAGVFTSLFTGCLALDQAMRLWDVYVFEGDAVLVRAGVALLVDHEAALLGAQTTAAVRAVLDGGDADGAGTARPQRVVAQQGEEDRWMQLVREVGKAPPAPPPSA